MARDEFREEYEKTNADRLADIAKAALTVGVGAAVFYRAGGRRLLSEGVDITRRALRDLSDTYGKQALAETVRDRGIKALSEDVADSFRRAAEEVRESAISVRKYEARSMGHILNRYLTMKHNPEDLIKTAYRIDEIETPVKEMFVGKFGGDDAVFRREIERFIESAVKNIDDQEKIKSLTEGRIRKQLDPVQINEILQAIRERYRAAEPFDAYAKRYEKALDDAMKELIDPDNLRAVFGSSDQRTFRDLFLGDTPATIQDILDNPELFAGNKIRFQKPKGGHGSMELVDALRDMEARLREISDEKAEAFKKLYFDPNVLRKDRSGRIYSFTTTSGYWNRFLEDFANTLPGKILKTRAFQEHRKAPKFLFMPAQRPNPILSAVAEKTTSPLTSKHYVWILDQAYEFTEEGLKKVETPHRMYLTSGRYGTPQRLVKQMIGDVDYREPRNKLESALDINLAGTPNVLERLRVAFGKFSNEKWRGNVIQNLLNKEGPLRAFLIASEHFGDQEEILRDSALELISDARTLNRFYSKHTQALNRSTIEKLKERATGQAKEYFDLLLREDEELVEKLLTRDQSVIRDIKTSYLNEDLKSFLYKYIKDPTGALQSINIKADETQFFGGKRTMRFAEILRREVAKEAFMREADASGMKAVTELIESAGLAPRDARAARELADWAMFQYHTRISERAVQSEDLKDIIDTAKRIADIFVSREGESGEYFERFRKNLSRMAKEGVSKLEMPYDLYVDEEDIIRGNQYGQWMVMNRAVNPLDLIHNLNNAEKLKAFVKQFAAGRNDPQNITTATLIPYFFLDRLSEALNPIGLGFSGKSTASTATYIRNILLKRIVPVAVGITYFDYLNDLTQAVTGTSITGTFAQGIANIDLAFRRFTDATGLTEWLKDEKIVNPFLRYWTGPDYMSYEERLEWYRKGYSPIRKSRWWSFGSLSEFRGGQIAYWAPNYLRRATSDYRDKSLYEGFYDKWSHSPLPTPTNPLSPLFFLADPYWLERRHAEDRPYPMTGRLFSEYTPWGAVLNPTLGELIKPRRRMHTDRLDENFVDVRWLIEQRNREILAKAQEKQGYLVQFAEGQITPVNFTPLGAPTPSQRVLQFRAIDGSIVPVGEYVGYGEFSGVPYAPTVLSGAPGPGTEEEGGEAPAGYVFGEEGTPEGLGFFERMEIRARSGEFLPGLITQTAGRLHPMFTIGEINKGIKEKAAGRPLEPGVVTPASIYREEARYGSHILQNEEALSDLRGLASGDDVINEIAHSTRYIAGIYGYAFHRLFPGRPYAKLTDASQMTSFTRRFEDLYIGGFGGGYMEIVRRFLPFEDRTVQRINPLMNTMPDWMPMRFRFGDPYASIPRGEARLPGKGYEALNELHPDQFGRYGAFDRFKILADVAPYSEEYKIWRDIAFMTVRDPELRKEMEEIRERVREQSKTYDFYSYVFLGKDTKREVKIIDQILNNNYFTVVGEDTVYRMAGITVSGGETGSDNTLSRYLRPGMEVVLEVDENPYEGTNEDRYGSVNAAVFVDGFNINKQLLRENLAVRRESDRSAAAGVAMFSDFQRLRGMVFEAMAHAPIPYFQQKFWRIRDPLESYKHEQVYGTPFASWSRPIDSFLKPAIERSLMSGTELVIGLGALALHLYAYQKDAPKGLKTATNVALLLTNRGAFIGGFLGNRIFGYGGGVMRKGALIGAAFQAAAYIFTRRESVPDTTFGAGVLGGIAGYLFSDKSGMEKAIDVLRSAGKGAAAGLAVSAAQSSVFSEGGLDPTWIPERTREKWELQEYFDRLQYIKYSGLFEKAARRALLLEGTNIKGLIERYEDQKERKDKLRQELEEERERILKSYPEGDQRREELLAKIDAQLAETEDREFYYKVGKWGRAALVYYEAMRSTIYGLEKDATWAQILRAIPRNERDYFIEFAKVKDPEKRKEILKYVSPYHRRALQIAWGEEPDEPESMSSFFDNHYLPPATWSGWRPEIDLADVQVKVIENEGMLLSDFGFYESQLRDPNAAYAPYIEPDEKQSGAAMRANLISSLKGFGLTGVDVSVTPKSSSGIEAVVNYTRIVKYNIEQKFRELISF